MTYILGMLHHLLVLLRGPRATDTLHQQRVQFDLLQSQMEVVLAGLRRGDISIEDFLVQREE
ncbi:hypothetical protein F0U61_06440 [Archangium violaceum]|uniref:hypothetical protein n=1 Tax=Archangium violaceum TaxID=83451 RepID=UPI002B28D97F|nr:hypothetical protein F0U61_06440 [Archangium violaceum]